MANDGSIKISIEVDGKEVEVASKDLDNLEKAGSNVGKGIKSAESSMDGLADSSAKASKGLKETDSAMSGISDSSSSAAKDIKGTSDSIDSLSDSGAKAGKDLKGVGDSIGDVSGSSEQAASGIKGVSDGLDNMSAKASEAAESTDKVRQSTDGVGEGTTRASIGLKDLATSLGLVAVASAAFDTLKSSLDAAIGRFDTLNGFPPIMEKMGFSSEQAESSINKLSDGIQGLPTTLNGIVDSAQNIAILTGDLESATDTALALNNAFLASGAIAQDAERGLVQYVQMLSKGEVDMQSWRTLQETMGYALNETAEAFGFAGAAAQNDLYDALKYGSISFDDFNAKIIELSEGVGGFAEMASTGSEGIAVSFGNLRNAFVVGVASMITSFDNLSQATTGQSIYKNLDSLKVVVGTSFKAINSTIEAAAPVVIFFGSAVSGVIPVVKALTPAIIGLMAAYGSYLVISKVSGVINASNAILAAAIASQRGLTLATNAQIAAKATEIAVEQAVSAAKAKGVVLTEAQTAAIVKNTLADKAAMAAAAAELGMTNARTIAIGVLTGQLTISAGVKAVATAASYALAAAWRFMMGPIGWIITGIGLLVTGVIALVKWFNKSTEEAKMMTESTEGMVDSVNSLTDSVKNSSSAYADNLSNIGATAKAHEDLAQKIQDLSEKEKKTAADKLLLADYVGQLNDSIDGLNLSYHEEANAMNMSAEHLAERIKLMQDLEASAAGQERLLEITKEQTEVEMQLSEVNELRQEWHDKLEAGAKEAAAGLAELDEQERLLTDTNAELSQQYAITSEQITESMESIARTTQDNVDLQLVAFANLSDGNERLVDDMMSQWSEYHDAATDMFDKLTDKSKLSISEMQKNLEENQRVIGEWADNIATLSERGIDEGLLEKLRAAGPESAGYVKELVNSSDAELQKLSDTFANGGDVATEAFSKSLGIGGNEVAEAVGDLVDRTTRTMQQKIEDADFNAVGQSVPEGFKTGIEGKSSEAVDAAVKMADDTVKETKKTLETNSPSKVFTEIGESAPEGMTLGINNGTPKAIDAAKKLAMELLKPFDKTPSDFERIGNEAMAGFNRGLNSGKAQVLATAKSIADQAAQTMRKALDIHSPSRVTEKIGKETGQGFTKGISKQEKKSSAAAKKVAQAAAKNFKEAFDKSQYDFKMGKVDAAEHIKSLEKVRKNYAKTPEQIRKVNLEIVKVQKKHAKDIEKMRKDDYNKSKKFIDNKKYFNEMSLKDELAAWERVQSRFKKGSEERIEAEKNIYRVKKEIQKEEFNYSKKWIDDRKYYNELSLKEELDAWERVQSRYAEGTEQRIEADRQVYRVKKEINDQLLKLNDDYYKRVKDVNDKLIEDTKKLNDEYNQSYSKRFDELKNFAGLLDEFVETDYVSGYQLIHNMQTQVDALEEFSSVMGSLGDRIDNDALFEELQALGPKSIAELRELNDMSEEELTEFTRLYEKRFELARTQATTELEPLKDDITQQIKDLNEASKAELLLVEKEWKKAINNVVLGTQKEFDSMNQVGKDAMKGLESGILSMESSLMATTRRIADSISATMKSALDINSPSRVMRDEVGKWIPEGIALGIKDNAKSVYRELENMTNKMIIPASPEQALGTSRMAYNGRGGFNGGNTFSTSTDNSRKQKNDIKIITNDSGAKEMERTLRRLQFGL